METDFIIQVDELGPAYCGNIYVGCGEDCYVDIIFGRKPVVVQELEEKEFFGLALHIRRRVRSRIVGYLTGMLVPEEMRGRGIGKGMLDLALSELKKRKVKVLFVHLEPFGDLAARIRFYERFGFEEVDCCEQDLIPVFRLKL